MLPNANLFISDWSGSEVLDDGKPISKTKRFMKTPVAMLKENRFTPVANSFFYPLTAIDQHREHLDLIVSLLFRVLGTCFRFLFTCFGIVQPYSVVSKLMSLKLSGGNFSKWIDFLFQGRDSELLSRILFCMGHLIRCSGASPCTVKMVRYVDWTKDFCFNFR